MTSGRFLRLGLFSCGTLLEGELFGTVDAEESYFELEDTKDGFFLGLLPLKFLFLGFSAYALKILFILSVFLFVVGSSTEKHR